MPKIVDRERRRSEVVEAYLRLVERDGIEAATSRALAAERNVATGELWHYFDGFDEVLSEAFRRIFANTNDRIAAATADLTGLSALIRMLEEILPVGRIAQGEALVVVSFWGRVPSKPNLGRFQSRVEEQWRSSFVVHMRDAVIAGELSDDAPLDEIADLLLVLTVGMQVEQVLHTPIAATKRQWQLVRHALSPWITPTGETQATPGLSRALNRS